MNFYHLELADHRGNTILAFDIVSEQIVIPQLLYVEDVCDVIKTDVQSVMAYLAYWFHVFSALDKIETAGRRIQKFLEVTGSSLEK